MDRWREKISGLDEISKRGDERIDQINGCEKAHGFPKDNYTTTSPTFLHQWILQHCKASLQKIVSRLSQRPRKVHATSG